MNKKFWAFAAVCAVVAVLYIVIPFDAIPDLVAFIGWIDDLTVSLLGLAGLTVNILLALGVIQNPIAQKENDEYGSYQEV